MFVTATKLAGLLVTVTIAANAFSFSRYRKKNLLPFQTPIDESSDILASFNVDPTDGSFSFITLKYLNCDGKIALYLIFKLVFGTSSQYDDLRYTMKA